MASPMAAWCSRTRDILSVPENVPIPRVGSNISAPDTTPLRKTRSPTRTTVSVHGLARTMSCPGVASSSTGSGGAGALRRVHDFLRTLIKDQMIVRFHADSNNFVCLRHLEPLPYRTPLVGQCSINLNNG